MDHMDTQSQQTRRLQLDGYTANLAIDDQGHVVGDSHDWTPDQVTVDELLRFEGMSNPDDLAMLLAVTGPNKVKGLLVLPYGPDVSGDQADTIRSLTTTHRQQ